MQQSEITDQPPKAKEHLDEAKLKIIFEKIKMMFIVKMLKEDGHPIEVIPNLYIGSMGTAYSKDNLLAVQIKHILTVCEQKKCPFTDHFNYLVIPVADSPDQSLMEYFEEGIKFIDNAVSKGESILVHCFAGKSRSSSFIIAYLIKHKKMTLEDALALLKSKRPIVQPNTGFMQQLENFQKLHQEK